MVMLGFHKEVQGDRFGEVSRALRLPTEFNRAKRGWFEMPFADLDGTNYVAWFQKAADHDAYWELPEVETNAVRVTDAKSSGLSDEECEILSKTFDSMLAALRQTHGFIHITYA